MASLPSPVLILGARSDIGRALARAYAKEGCDVILAARGAGQLDADRADLETRFGIAARVAEFDVTDPDPDAFFAGLDGIPGTVVMVAGLIGDQAKSEQETAAADVVMRTNYNGPAMFLLAAARTMEKAGKGAIVGISSVAGDRGRASNFIYGSAKAGFTAFLSGLRNRLAKKGISVMTVKPGFVATQMTAGMDLPARLTAQPAGVARAVVDAQLKGRDVIYAKALWRPIMFAITMIPERMFKKMSI